MELSIRLQAIADLVDNCESIADIGTDHGYIPIYLVKKGVCKKAIASDINKGPINKAKMNIGFDGLNDKIKCCHGPGLKPLKVGEANAIVIAGMGGNLIRDILLADLNKVKKYEFMILQPTQNPEVLREFLYNNEYEIIDENIIFEDKTYYEMFKVKYKKNAEKLNLDSIFYEISPVLLRKKHILINNYINFKIGKNNKVIKNIKQDTELAKCKKEELIKKVSELENLLIK